MGAKTKALAIALLLTLFAAGGVVGFVVGKRQASAVSSAPDRVGAGPARVDRFARRLKLTPDQREAVAEILKSTKESVATVKKDGSDKILAILDDEQKVRYRKMLERQKERRANRKEAKRGKRKKKRGQPR